MLDSPARTARRRRAAALLVALPALLVAGVATAGAASAHDELVSASPRDGSTVPAPAQVVLRFSDVVLPGFSRMVLTRPDGTTVATPVTVVGPRVTGRLPASLAPGGYTVTWRVSSADGHPVSGELGFTVRVGATATATPTATPTGVPATAVPTTAVPTTAVPTTGVPATAAAPSAPAAARPTRGNEVPAAAIAVVPVLAVLGALAVAVRRARRQPRG